MKLKTHLTYYTRNRLGSKINIVCCFRNITHKPNIAEHKPKAYLSSGITALLFAQKYKKINILLTIILL